MFAFVRNVWWTKNPQQSRSDCPRKVIQYKMRRFCTLC